MYCGQCGAKNDDDAVFCVNCGEKIQPQCDALDDQGERQPLVYEKKKYGILVLMGVVSVASIVIFISLTAISVTNHSPVITNESRDKEGRSKEKEGPAEQQMSQDHAEESTTAFEGEDLPFGADLENYSVTKLVDNMITIDNTDVFYVSGTDNSTGEKCFLKLNTNGRVLETYPWIGDDFTRGKNFVDDLYRVYPDTRKIYDLQGNNVTEEYLDEDEELLMIAEDSTGWTFWVGKSIDTVDSHEYMIKACDLHKNVKAFWYTSYLEQKHSINNLSKYGVIDYEDLLQYAGGSSYTIKGRYSNGKGILLCVETNADFGVYGAQEYTGVSGMFITRERATADDDYVFWCSDHEYHLYTTEGTEITPQNTNVKSAICYNGEGTMLVRDSSDRIYVMDQHGVFLFEITDYTGISEFHDGFAQIAIENEGGVRFNSLIDRNGNLAFEPVKSSAWGFYDEMWKYQWRGQDEDSLMNSSGEQIPRPKDDYGIYIRKGDAIIAYIELNGERLEWISVDVKGTTGQKGKEAAAADIQEKAPVPDTEQLPISQSKQMTSLRPEQIYQEILDMYYEHTVSGWSGMEDVSPIIAFDYWGFSRDLSQMGYLFSDLDGDGIPELIISRIGEPGALQAMVFDLYTTDGKRIVHAASSGERSMYHLRTDGSLKYMASDSALTGEQALVVLDPGSHTLRTTRKIKYDGYADEAHPWREVSADGTETMISEAEAREIEGDMDMLVDSINITPLSEYAYKGE